MKECFLVRPYNAIVLFIVTSVACAVGPSFTMSSTDFSFKNLVFLEFIWIFSGRNHLKTNISHIWNPNLTKYIPLNPTHEDLSTTLKAHSNFFKNFSEKIIQYSRTFTLQVQAPWNQADAPLLLKSFPKRWRVRFKAS
jgi:hypothetical protein